MSESSEVRLAQRIALGGLAVTLVLGLLSDGVHHDDDLTHFLMARWVWWFPEYLVHFWARPGFTVPYAALAGMGEASTAWHVCRGLSAVLQFAATVLAVGVARKLKTGPLWAVALACYAQPLGTLLAGTTLTETIGAFYLIAAVALLLSGRSISASAVFSLVLVTRYETVLLLPVWWLVVRSSRRGRRPGEASGLGMAFAVSLWAPAVHQLLLMGAVGAAPWRAFLSPTGTTEYGAGGLLTYFPRALHAVPPAILATALVGGGRLVSAGRWPVPAMAGVYLLTHMVLRGAGLFASGGFGRFMVLIAPLVAILAAAGLGLPASRGFSQRPRRSIWIAAAFVFGLGTLALRWEVAAGRLAMPPIGAARHTFVVGLGITGLLAAAGLWPLSPIRRVLAGCAAGVMAVSVAVQFAIIVRPLRMGEDAQLLRAGLSRLKDMGLAGRPIFAPTPWAAYSRDWAESPRHYKGRKLAASMPVGTIMIWDAVYSPNDYHRLPLEVFSNDAAYRSLGALNGPKGTARFVFFEKVAPTAIPSSEPRPYPPEIMATATPSGWYYVDCRRTKSRTE